MKKATISPEQALQKLLAGNARFLKSPGGGRSRVTEEARRALVDGQAPFAAVLTCADSRTPPEHLFDAGLGELFVCRNAGNLADKVTLGSLEYAVAHLGCTLVAVMGHNRCGAVAAAVAAAMAPGKHESENLDAIVTRIIPAVLATRKEGQSREAWVDEAAKRNVRDTCAEIARNSPIISEKAAFGAVAVKALWYDLESGRVSEL